MLRWTLLVALCSAAVATPLLNIRTDEQSPHFIDSEGRVRFFHGVSSVQKGPPWYPYWLQNDTLVDWLAETGFNFVRLGWMWSGFEPSEGQFNETYFQITEEIVENLASRGIYTLLDAHQDVLSSEFCLYDGFPQWVINKTLPDVKHPFPWPMHGNCSSRNWMMNILSEAAANAYQELYDNTHGVRDSFARFWTESAKRWANNSNVIGFELINEPFAGDYFKHPTILLPGEAGKRNLQPLYDVLSDAIRPIDDSHILFYEPVTWGMLFEGKIVGPGFTQVPGGVDHRNMSALSYHYYCSSFGGDRKICDGVLGPSMFKSIREEVGRIGGASMMTEFGACGDDNLAECEDVLALTEKNLQSWSDWESLAAGSVPGPAWRLAYARPYPRAIAGQPLNMTFHTDSRELSLCYTLQSSTMDTEVFVSPVQYNNGVKVHTTSNLKAWTTKKGDIVNVASAPGAVNGEVGCVIVSPLP